MYCADCGARLIRETQAATHAAWNTRKTRRDIERERTAWAAEYEQRHEQARQAGARHWRDMLAQDARDELRKRNSVNAHDSDADL